MNTETSSGSIVSPEERRPDDQGPPETSAPATSPSPPRTYPVRQYPTGSESYPYPTDQPLPRPRRTHWAPWLIGGLLGAVVVGCMLTALVVAVVTGVFLSAVTGPRATISTTQTFAVTDVPNLVISNPAGNVTLQVGNAGQVTAQVQKHAQGRTEAISQANAQRIAVDLSQSGNTITVTARFDTTAFDGGTVRRTVDLIVTVPHNAHANIHLGAGNIDARGVHGEMRLVDGAGNVTTQNATFSGSSQLKTGAGNVTADCALADGSTMDVNVGAGNITLTLPANTPAHVDASTGIGNLTISGWSLPIGHAGAATYHATGDLSANPTATLTAHVGTGNLTISSR